MDIISYISYVPVWIILKEFFLKKTTTIRYLLNDNFEKFSNSMIIFNTCFLIYEFILHYISFLNNFYNIHIFYTIFIRNIINIILYRKYTNYITYIRNMNISIYTNILLFIIQLYLISLPIESTSEDDNVEKGYKYSMFLCCILYITIYAFVFIKYYKNFKFEFLSLHNDPKNIDSICCICIEPIQEKLTLLNCCSNFIHYNCILEYKNYNINNICPLCRRNIDIINTIYL